MPRWLMVLAGTSVTLGLATAALITLAVIRRPQRMKIMNIVWPVTGLYLPVVAWWLYRSMGRQMAIDAHLDPAQDTATEPPRAEIHS